MESVWFSGLYILSRVADQFELEHIYYSTGNRETENTNTKASTQCVFCTSEASQHRANSARRQKDRLRHRTNENQRPPCIASVTKVLLVWPQFSQFMLRSESDDTDGTGKNPCGKFQLSKHCRIVTTVSERGELGINPNLTLMCRGQAMARGTKKRVGTIHATKMGIHYAHLAAPEANVANELHA